MSEIKIRRVIAWFLQRCPVYAMMVPLVSVAHGGAYLPLIGPPALRFETVVQYKDILSWMPKPKPVLIETNSPSVTTTISTNNAVTTATVVTP